MIRILSLVSFLLLISCGQSELPSYGVVPDFLLTDQNGQPFRSSDRLRRQVWVADFIFTNCGGPCPRMSGQMKDLHARLASSGVRFVSFTVDPARDTPPVLASYARRYHADPNRWSFLTGSEADLHQLSRFVFRLSDVDGSLGHSTRFVLVDRKARIRGFYDTSDPANIEKLASDAIRLARNS